MKNCVSDDRFALKRLINLYFLRVFVRVLKYVLRVGNFFAERVGFGFQKYRQRVWLSFSAYSAKNTLCSRSPRVNRNRVAIMKPDRDPGVDLAFGLPFRVYDNLIRPLQRITSLFRPPVSYPF